MADCSPEGECSPAAAERAHEPSAGSSPQRAAPAKGAAVCAGRGARGARKNTRKKKRGSDRGGTAKKLASPTPPAITAVAALGSSCGSSSVGLPADCALDDRREPQPVRVFLCERDALGLGLRKLPFLVRPDCPWPKFLEDVGRRLGLKSPVVRVNLVNGAEIDDVVYLEKDDLVFVTTAAGALARSTGRAAAAATSSTPAEVLEAPAVEAAAAPLATATVAERRREEAAPPAAAAAAAETSTAHGGKEETDVGEGEDAKKPKRTRRKHAPSLSDASAVQWRAAGGSFVNRYPGIGPSPPEDWVSLNVGGKIFATTKSTLTRCRGSMFEAVCPHIMLTTCIRTTTHTKTLMGTYRCSTSCWRQAGTRMETF